MTTRARLWHRVRNYREGGRTIATDAGPRDILNLAEIGRMDFRTSRSGDTATGALLRALDLQYRYQPARLALGRSLGIATAPAAVENFDGRVIRGETLLGQSAEEIGLWASLVSEHAGNTCQSRRAFQDLVAAHWARGASLLWDSLRSSSDPVADISQQLLRTA